MYRPLFLKSVSHGSVHAGWAWGRGAEDWREEKVSFYSSASLVLSWGRSRSRWRLHLGPLYLSYDREQIDLAVNRVSGGLRCKAVSLILQLVWYPKGREALPRGSQEQRAVWEFGKWCGVSAPSLHHKAPPCHCWWSLHWHEHWGLLAVLEAIPELQGQKANRGKEFCYLGTEGRDVEVWLFWNIRNSARWHLQSI